MDYQIQKPSVKAVSMLVLILLCVFGIKQVFPQANAPDKHVIIASVELTGNKKTLNYIIYRELLFAAGDTLPVNELDLRVRQSRLNLLNTSLFNFVTIDTAFHAVPGSPVWVDVKISVLERWYIWTVPIVKITDRNLNAWWQSRDFTRINYGLDVKWYNFTGRMDEMDANIQLGKNRQFILAYHNPYIDRNKRLGLGFEAGFRKNRETGYITENDKLVFAFVPAGLSTEKYFAANSSWRNNIFTTHELAIGWRDLAFSDSLLVLNPDYSFAGETAVQYLYLSYKLKIDHRDIKYYPLKGWYADLELNKTGLGSAFGETVDQAWAKTTLRFFAQHAARWYSGISFIGKVSSGAWQPYFLMQGLGYNRDYVRGYEYNVIDGKHYIVVRSNVKFALVPEHTRNIGFIPAPKFGRIHYALYLTAFADAAYVWQPQWIGLNNNLLPRTFLAGAGLGADLVTYYDKVVRIEYALNRSGESGIFIHFIAGL